LGFFSLVETLVESKVLLWSGKLSDPWWR